LPFYGLAVICADDPEARALIPQIARPYLTYGFAEGVDFRAVDVQRRGAQSTFDVLRPERPAAVDHLNLPGRTTC